MDRTLGITRPSGGESTGESRGAAAGEAGQAHWGDPSMPRVRAHLLLHPSAHLKELRRQSAGTSPARAHTGLTPETVLSGVTEVIPGTTDGGDPRGGTQSEALSTRDRVESERGRVLRTGGKHRKLR